MKRERNRAFFSGILIGLSVAVLLMYLLQYLGIRPLLTQSLADSVWEKATVLEGYIDKAYWKENVSKEKMADYAAKGIVASLEDKYSAYFTDEEYRRAINNVTGDYPGIGVVIETETDSMKKRVVEVKTGSPGDRAGLKSGDEIVTLNGADAAKLSMDDMLSELQEEGKKSVFGIAREEDGERKEFEVAVVSEKIVNQSVSHKLLSGKIGYINIKNFDNETVKQFESALKSLDEKGQKSLIVDLRNNTGGTLTAAVDILDFLLPEGTLITEKNRMVGDKVYKSTNEKQFGRPMAVLVNERSASASEVFAGTLQDRGAAKLVGVQTYGKGIVQTIFSLKEACGGGLKLTTGEYLLPSGRSIHEKGLTPDVECKYTGATEELGGEDDNQLAKAVECLGG